jgi:AdoMet-dependent rRNA methyltransferase SPB1
VNRYKSHPATTNEILALCEDLKVLGKSDFKRLLKWRLQMRQFRDEQNKANEQEEEEDEEGE